MASIDTTVYALEKTPQQNLRSMFACQDLNPAMRKAIADKGILTIDVFAQLGTDGKSAVERLLKLGGLTEAMPAGEDDKELESLKLAAIWSLCGKMSEVRSTYELKYAEDPSKIPVIPAHERIVMRAAWLFNHAELKPLLDVQTEPHDRFVDRLKRDFTVNGRVSFLEAVEFRVKADKVVYAPGVGRTLEDLLQQTREELPGEVSTEESLINRVFAFHIALEYLGIASKDDFTHIFMRYWADLRKFNKEYPGLRVLIKADRLVRGEVEKLIEDKPGTAYGAALKAVLDTQPTLMLSAVLKMEVELAQAARGQKRPAEATHAEALPSAGTLASQRAGAGPPPTSGVARKKRLQKQRASERLEAAPSAAVTQSRATAQVTRSSEPGFARFAPAPGGRPNERKKTREDPARRIPVGEYDVLSGLPNKQHCLHWNSTLGCTFGESCRFKHRCRLCDGEHRWCERHL